MNDDDDDDDDSDGISSGVQSVVRVDRVRSPVAWSLVGPAARSRFDFGCSERRTPARLVSPEPVTLDR